MTDPIRAAADDKWPSLQWTANLPPCEECRYDHCTAETPFGRFLITWKGWKKYQSPTVDETPWGDWFDAFNSVDEAKAACQQGMNERLARWCRQPAPPAEARAARPLLEQVARMGDRIGQHTVGEIMAISDRAAAWLQENPPGQPVAIEPRGCPTPGACSCVEPAPVPVSERLPGHVEQALIKAECALSDIAEGEPEENECDSDELLSWAEQRAAAVLARIRPVMREHGIHTSEWPPLPTPTTPPEARS